MKVQGRNAGQDQCFGGGGVNYWESKNLFSFWLRSREYPFLIQYISEEDDGNGGGKWEEVSPAVKYYKFVTRRNCYIER